MQASLALGPVAPTRVSQMANTTANLARWRSAGYNLVRLVRPLGGPCRSDSQPRQAADCSPCAPRLAIGATKRRTPHPHVAAWPVRRLPKRRRTPTSTWGRCAGCWTTPTQRSTCASASGSSSGALCAPQRLGRFLSPSLRSARCTVYGSTALHDWAACAQASSGHGGAHARKRLHCGGRAAHDFSAVC